MILGCAHGWQRRGHSTKIWRKPLSERVKTRFSVNVLVGLLNNNIVGPYILPNRLNSPTYLVFLRDIRPILLENVPSADRMEMWFQNYGYPAHYGNNVTGGAVPWPSRSPNLTLIDFFIWGLMYIISCIAHLLIIRMN